ncbi:MAG: glycosyltransferase family 4 protein [Cyanobacteria bacterium CRU_2_1]|nr:glycosyltransferase family 4 protein [Cyanobacteria bacterium RU_5_0]NJR58862.1 glycosyltransferase family 4 protein [Cyanobacteria bacterium CRU_2_1]
MKITVVMGGLTLAGGDRVLATYAQQLQSRGHDVFLIARPPQPVTFRQHMASLVRGRGLIPKRKRLSHFDNIDVPRHFVDRFRPITDADLPDADVVIATWWETAEWVANLSPAKGTKVYFVQHHEVFDYLPKEKVEASYSLPLHKITVSQWIADIMRERYNDFNVSLVPNSVDTAQFYAPPRGKQPLPTIGVMYATAPWKGCDISFKAFSLASERIPNLRLLAFGSQALSPDLPLPPGSEFAHCPSQDVIRGIYSQCDVWLFGSRAEGFGLPILEAMACRTPVIGTPAGAAPELLTDGAGILVKPEDPDDMAMAIEHICNLSEAEWKQMSDAAYSKIANYTIEDAVTLFESALDTAIDRQKHGEFSNSNPLKAASA